MSSRETRKFPHMWDTTLLEAKVLTERWRMDYNTIRKYETTAQRAGVSAAGGACGGSAAVFRYAQHGGRAGKTNFGAGTISKSKLKTWRIML